MLSKTVNNGAVLSTVFVEETDMYFHADRPNMSVENLKKMGVL